MKKKLSDIFEGNAELNLRDHSITSRLLYKHAKFLFKIMLSNWCNNERYFPFRNSGNVNIVDLTVTKRLFFATFWNLIISPKVLGVYRTRVYIHKEAKLPFELLLQAW